MIPVKTGVVRVASIYAPNGNPVNSDKFPYKLEWLERLKTPRRETARRSKSRWR